YVSISTADLSDEEIEEKKADAQEILDTMKEDPEADFDETASAVSEDYSALTGTFDANVPETEETDGEEMTSTSAYPDEVMEVLRTLDDGEMGPDVIETDTAFYVVRLDLKNDEHETEHKIEDIISEREEELYTDTTQQWMDEAEITVDEEVLKTLKLTDSHKFSIDTSASEETADTTETAEDTAPDDSTAAEETDSDAAAETDSAAADSGDTLSEDEILVPVEEDVPSTEEADTEESADTEAADAEEADDSAETDEAAEEDTADDTAAESDTAE
ncbi:MAG TPA: FKBP-type peptidylprolyl isomerase, partial [Candidatus Blautia excrementigallinarum]|nr:FKBP-type peptidylprolyl isomerase [Candidatus Blautia excrementigallinarum]